MRKLRRDIVRPGLVGLLAVGAIFAAGCRSTQSDPERPGFRVRPGVAFEMAVDAPDMPIIDLRRPDEYDGPLGHLPRSWNLPLDELPQRLPEIRWMRGVTFLVYCRGYDWEGEPTVGTGAPRQAGAPLDIFGGGGVRVAQQAPEPVAASHLQQSAPEPTPGQILEETLEQAPEATSEETPAQTPGETSGEVPEEAHESRPEPRSERYRDLCGEEAIRFLLGQGFEDAVLLEGGIAAWLDDGYSTIGRGAQGPDMVIPTDPGYRVPPGAHSIGDPRYLPEPP